MTEEEMKKRMQEIDKERNQLRVEIMEYEDYFRNKRIQEKIEHHKTFVGKCFISQNCTENKNPHIKAFKILCIEDSPDVNYAKCIVLIDGCMATYFKEYGVCIRTLPLWNPNKFCIVNKESEPTMIDFYKEISQDEFDKLYKEHLGNMEIDVYKQVGNVNNEGSNQ